LPEPAWFIRVWHESRIRDFLAVSPVIENLRGVFFGFHFCPGLHTFRATEHGINSLSQRGIQQRQNKMGYDIRECRKILHAFFI
jgi:hypothetical protein